MTGRWMRKSGRRLRRFERQERRARRRALRRRISARIINRRRGVKGLIASWRANDTVEITDLGEPQERSS